MQAITTIGLDIATPGGVRILELTHRFVAET
jgi:hypothetical protein